MIACPSCGFIVFPGPYPGSFDLCPICTWEDNEVLLANPCYKPNGEGASLAEWQQASLSKWPTGITSVDGYLRDPKWRPISDRELDRFLREAHEIEGGRELNDGVWNMSEAYWNKEL